MEPAWLIGAAVVSFLVGGTVGWLLLRARVAELRTALDGERRTSQEKLALLEEAQEKARERLSDAFQSLSAQALKSNNESFLTLARSTLETAKVEASGELEKRKQAVEALVAPIGKSLEKVDRVIQSVAATQVKLEAETGNLVKALRAPAVRGRWGEIQLQRVVEIAGMVEHCDFLRQETVDTGDGRLRPDMVVKLPGGRNIVVDAKAPIQAFIDAVEAPDEPTRLSKLKEHARQVRAHLARLSGKAYWEQFQPTPDLVVLFLPGEALYSAALQQEPSLIEEAMKMQVIVATPPSLMGLLRAVAVGWREQKLARNAQEISDLGRDLYERMRILAGHFERLGRELGGAVDAYNGAVGSIEGRVLPAARKFKELGAGTAAEIEQLQPVERAPRALQAPELSVLPGLGEDEPGRLPAGQTAGAE